MATQFFYIGLMSGTSLDGVDAVLADALARPPTDGELARAKSDFEYAFVARLESLAERARLLLQGVAHVKSVYTTIGGGSAGSDPFVNGGAAEVRRA